MFCKELSYRCVLSLECTQSSYVWLSNESVDLWYQTDLVTSAARKPDEVMTMVWGVPAFLDAEDKFFGFPDLGAYRSKKSGRFGRSLGCSHALVSRNAFSMYVLGKLLRPWALKHLHTYQEYAHLQVRRDLDYSQSVLFVRQHSLWASDGPSSQWQGWHYSLYQ